MFMTTKSIYSLDAGEYTILSVDDKDFKDAISDNTFHFERIDNFSILVFKKGE